MPAVRLLGPSEAIESTLQRNFRAHSSTHQENLTLLKGTYQFLKKTLLKMALKYL